MEFKGITVGTYISRKPKNKNEKDICANCEVNTKIQKSKYIDKEKEYELCKNCDKCYVSKSCKALVTIGRDTTTGKTIRKTFGAETDGRLCSPLHTYTLKSPMRLNTLIPLAKACASASLLIKPVSIKIAGIFVSRSTKKFAVFTPRSTAPVALISSCWTACASL